jgi:hypothetical protein
MAYIQSVPLSRHEIDGTACTAQEASLVELPHSAVPFCARVPDMRYRRV